MKHRRLVSNSWILNSIMIGILLIGSIVQASSLGIVSSSQNFLAGSGTENDPFLITSLADFDGFAANSSYWSENIYTKLVADINLIGRTYTKAVIAPDTDSSNEATFDGTEFNGILDGNNHKILKLNINNGSDANDFLGLFGQIGVKGKVKNLILEGANVTSPDIGAIATYFIGSLAGRNMGEISNCSSAGNVTVNYSGYIGGLVGQNETGLISNCHNDTNVTAGDYCGFIGGLAGVNIEATIRNSYSKGNVTAGYLSNCIGGLAGTNETTSENACSNIIDCYSIGNVTAGDDSSDVGGLAGRNYGHGANITSSYANGYVIAGSGSYLLGGLSGENKNAEISNCYANVSVTGQTDSQHLGGLCGYNWDANIINCYSTGRVQNGSYVAGLCGVHRGGLAIIKNSFWNTETSGLTTGYNLSSASPGTILNVLGKTTEQMKNKSTFTSSGWDFFDETANGSDDIWRLCTDGKNYPKFYWEFTKGDFTCPDGIDFKDYAVLASLWMNELGNTNWRQRYDISKINDNIINTADLLVFCENWLNGKNEGSIGMTWVYINDPGVPGHSGFNGYMSKYLTTNAQYCEYLNTAKSSNLITIYSNMVYAITDSSHSQPYFSTQAASLYSQIAYSNGTFSVRTRDGFSMAKHPVVCVSWYGAKAFCDYYGYSLPTEWQWQAAADYDGTYTYGCGTSIDSNKANYSSNNPLHLTSIPYTTPVDYYPAYGYGLCDMSGNAWGWTSSVYSGSFHIIRGSRWDFGAGSCTVSNSGYGSSNCTYDGNGSEYFASISFRVCR